MADSTGEAVGALAAPRRGGLLLAKKGRGSSWQYQETVALLQLWGQRQVQEELRTSHRNLETFERIAQGMRRRGYPRGAAECRTKTKKLKGEYKQALQRRAGAAGADEARRWPFFRMLSRILRQPPDGPPTPEEAEERERERAAEEEEEEEEEEGEERRRRRRAAAAFQDNENEVMLDLLVKEEDTDDAGDGSCAGPATDPATPRTLEAQPVSDPEAGHPATAATLPPPARLAWLRRRKTKSAKVESLLLQMLHQDAEESRETREAVERGWARLEAWARAEQESRARDAEREQQHRQEVLNCMRQTNALIRSFMGDTSLLLRRILEAPRMEDGGGEGAAEGSVDGTGRTAAGSRLAGHRQAKRKAGSVDDDDAATGQSPAGSTTP